MQLDRLTEVMATARLFHSADVSALLEEAQFEAEERKRRRGPPMRRPARDPLDATRAGRSPRPEA